MKKPSGRILKALAVPAVVLTTCEDAIGGDEAAF